MQDKRKTDCQSPQAGTPYEKLLISAFKEEMILYMKNHPSAFSEAVALAVTDKQPFAWRSAWLLWSCMKPNDPRVKKHITKIITYLPAAQDNQKRELLKILLMMELSEDHEGVLFDQCIDLWKDISKDPSIRMNALKMMLKIALKYPELNGEIIMIANEHYMDTLSPGARVSAKRLLKAITPQLCRSMKH